MSRPLIVSDCDEVLLYMVSHFRDWLGEEHGIDFDMGSSSFAQAMRHRDSGEPVGSCSISFSTGRCTVRRLSRARSTRLASLPSMPMSWYSQI
jgi:hypothetical protein